jgi:hypothetical protein
MVTRHNVSKDIYIIMVFKVPKAYVRGNPMTLLVGQLLLETSAYSTKLYSKYLEVKSCTVLKYSRPKVT